MIEILKDKKVSFPYSDRLGGLEYSEFKERFGNGIADEIMAQVWHGLMDHIKNRIPDNSPRIRMPIYCITFSFEEMPWAKENTQLTPN